MSTATSTALRPNTRPPMPFSPDKPVGCQHRHSFHGTTAPNSAGPLDGGGEEDHRDVSVPTTTSDAMSDLPFDCQYTAKKVAQAAPAARTAANPPALCDLDFDPKYVPRRGAFAPTYELEFDPDFDLDVVPSASSRRTLPRSPAPPPLSGGAPELDTAAPPVPT